ncbi:flagella synthesis protein FlgN [Gallionella capsiferriformans]|uniref:FlgN family protein n=1 Tax=Gallionella capsiferriformans (strain ES-2) TaxID=395494 RepID=D9SEX0_GALCS|nr:flagellar protein FlgN [Gallionella capsiferriformans]ADL55067.1 FlgN family protein [Gallionella capsiferriformans ES-2]
MSHADHTTLMTAFSDERLAVRGFVDLLLQEQSLLTENSIDPLLILAEKKSAEAVRLNELAESRRRLLEKYVGVLSSAAIQSWLEAHNHECLLIWQEICTLAAQAGQLNNVNGELIQMKLRHNQQSLTALTRAVSQANLYGPDGQTNFSAGTGRSLGSV